MIFAPTFYFIGSLTPQSKREIADRRKTDVLTIATTFNTSYMAQESFTSNNVDWLARYAGNYHDWRVVKDGEETSYVRPLGIVETAFDHDGIDFEGRADVNALSTFEAKISVSEEEFRSRILLAWASLRAHHGLLRCKVLDGSALPRGSGSSRHERHFVVTKPRNVSQILDEARQHIVFVEDYYKDVNIENFCRHVMNTTRTIDPAVCLSKLFVLPRRRLSNGHFTVNFLMVAGHEITDGLTNYFQHSHLIRLLNTSSAKLEEDLGIFIAQAQLAQILPPAQETLYPPLSGNLARQRWIWTISKIFRHIRKPPPAAFPNPLRREKPFEYARSMPPTFDAVLDYAKTPPLNSFTYHIKLSRKASDRIIRLCRQAKISIGSGCFTVVALSMMIMRERYCSASEDLTSLPFVAGFPVNPRPFFRDPKTVPTDSLMLAFSDGISLPFLPSSLPLSSRFRVLARQAHRQLIVFQKRPRTPEQLKLLGLGPRSPSQLPPGNYLGMIERTEAMLPPHKRRRDENGNEILGLQGAYPARRAETGQTCGVSSVGDRTRFLTQGMVNLDSVENGDTGGGGVFKVDFRDVQAAVRVRDGEFLVGSAGDDEGLHFTAMSDGNANDEEKAEEWVKVVREMFEGDDEEMERGAVSKL